MKKLILVLSVLFISSSLYAATDLSVGFSMGIVPNMCGMGATILKDGAIGLNDDSLASAVGFNDIIWADNEMGVLLNNAKGTNAVPLKALSNQSEGAPINGMNFELSAMYNLTNVVNLPLFARLGFNYAFSYNNPQQKLTLGPGIDQAAIAGNFPAHPDGSYQGGKASLEWSASWIDIPITIGLVLPIADKGKVYTGLGFSYISGGWGIDAKFNSRYTGMLTAYEGQAAPLTTESVNETIEFQMTTFTLHYMMGAEVTVAPGLAVFIEYWLTSAAQNSFSDGGFKDSTSHVMTGAVAGPTAYNMDSRYIEDFAYPAIVGGNFFKFGVKYYIL